MPAKKTLRDFISRSVEVHGEKYSYDKSIYKNSSTKLTVVCPEHGEFMQTPNSHTQGKGCMKCSGKERLSTRNFIKRAISIHGNKYSYDEVDLINTRSKVKILCRVHGIFNQRPDIHLSGHGCQECAKIQRPISCLSNTIDFISKAQQKHGDKYIYTSTDYYLSKKAVSVICRKHGSFEVKPSFHLMGQGCPSCATGGYNPQKPGFVYVLSSSCGTMIKVGITNSPENRYASLANLTPFNFSISACSEVPGHSARTIERTIHKMLVPSKLSGFNGATEWFEFQQWPIEFIRNIRHFLAR